MHHPFGFPTSMTNPDLGYFSSDSRQPELSVKMPSPSTLKKELRYATQYLTAHKLNHSSKWTSELLLSITSNEEQEANIFMKKYMMENRDDSYQFNKVYQAGYDDSSDAVMLASNLFDLREFKKCAFVVSKYAKNPAYQSAIFMHYYSLFLAGEIRKEEEMYENEGNSKGSVNPELSLIQMELKNLHDKNQLNELNLYLYGLVLKETMQKDDAKKVFIKVLNAFPCFWSAWLELCKLIEEEDHKTILFEIKDHWMKNFFLGSFFMEKYKYSLCIEINSGLLSYFKNSNYIINQISTSFYNNQEFECALEYFEKLIEIDPFRYENMDIYSNILYIKENQGQLANLALRCFYNNKYNPETCCVVGNYYSLMGDHLKAVIYFRKALKLDRNCLAAWTLMGHEYLEMKNIPGAIEAYSNAVEIDSKDFRAWYGLGQTYELQSMYHYALYYYTRAVMSRPKDSRMWNAMGNCYDKMEKKHEATKCYERAENCKDKEGIALHQLAKLYSIIGLENKAVSCFEESLRRKDEEQIIDKELGETLLYLAKYYKKIKEL